MTRHRCLCETTGSTICHMQDDAYGLDQGNRHCLWPAPLPRPRRRWRSSSRASAWCAPSARRPRSTCAAPIRAHHIHVTEKGEPKFVGLAYYAASEDDLKRLAKAPGASAVEEIDEPGGGKRVRLTEPNGYQIEVVHGIATLPPIAGQAPEAQHRRGAAVARGRADAAAQGPVAREADRPRRADDAEIRRDGGLVPRDAGLRLLGRRLCRRARTT